MLNERQQSRARIAQYRAVLQQGDYTYITSDAILNKGCRYLWSLIWGSAILQPISLTLVSPTVRILQELPAYKAAIANRTQCVTDWLDSSNVWERPEYFSTFKYLIDNKRGRNYPSTVISIMNNPQQERTSVGQLISKSKETWDNVTEQQAIQQAVFHKHRDFTQIVISRDKNFLQGLHKLCNSIPGQSSLTTLMLDDDGYLFDPFDTTESDLMSKVATGKMAKLAATAPLFIDDSALKHFHASDFLNKIKPSLLNLNTSLSVLAFKNEPLPQSDLLITRAQEQPSTIKFVWLNDQFNKTDAIINAIITQEQPHILFITDRVTRAEKIQSRVAESGIRVDIYSINQYGFLSCRDGSQGKKQNINLFQAAQDKQRMLDAVKAGDINEVQKLATNTALWETGFITSLCQGSTNITEALVNQADMISASHIHWIITEFRQFQNPTYLEEHPKVYEILIKMLTKNIGLPIPLAEQLYEHLCDINDNLTASHVELDYLASLFREAIDNSSLSTTASLARFKRNILTRALPHSKIDLQKSLELQKHKVHAKQEQIRAQIRELEQQLAQLEKEEAAIDAELHSTTKTNKKRK